MSKPKVLYLTSLEIIVNDKGRERVNKAVAKEKDLDLPPKEGSKRWYEEMGVKPPPDLEDEIEEPEIDENGMVDLQEGEFDYAHNHLILERSDFSFAKDTLNDVTVVFTKNNLSFEVLEDADTIYEQLYIIDQTWFEKIAEELKWRVKRIFNKEKDLIL